MTVSFDRVVLVNAAGERKVYSAEQFLDLPLATRIQHILARDIEFFDGVLPVDRGEALKSLRRLSPVPR
jgi:hypothetical protein